MHSYVKAGPRVTGDALGRYIRCYVCLRDYQLNKENTEVIRNCDWNFTESSFAFWGRTQLEGINEDYMREENSELRVHFHSLIVLTFVPVDDVTLVFDQLREVAYTYTMSSSFISREVPCEAVMNNFKEKKLFLIRVSIPGPLVEQVPREAASPHSQSCVSAAFTPKEVPLHLSLQNVRHSSHRTGILITRKNSEYSSVVETLNCRYLGSTHDPSTASNVLSREVSRSPHHAMPLTMNSVYLSVRPRIGA
ncbi:hypothetical protein ANN_27687 [Periplaneta americana]|uniref:Uncharacterized protein n=1 Tax=Periplaneta americana TaxID=6978 RepID=A0ABQ8RWY4_PERAM|nr:hypothetical protein ANN_27687 [Periplaneta americana]